MDNRLIKVNFPQQSLYDLAQLFVPSGQVETVLPYGAGNINDTFLVTYSDGGLFSKFLLQRINHTVFTRPSDLMHNITQVAAHLQQVAYPLEILSPLTSENGKSFHQDKSSNYWRAFPFFGKTKVFQSVDTPELAYKGARAFGTFISALSSLPHQNLKITIPGFHYGSLRLSQFKSALKKSIPERAEKAKPEIAYLQTQVRIFEDVARSGMPLRIQHHDTKINNVLFSVETCEAFCVIDLDTVMPGIVLSDFGDMARSFASSASEDEADISKITFRLPVYQSMKEGFLESCKTILSQNELNNLDSGGLWITLMQVLRFLSDYLTGDKYYKIKYPEHNLVRTRNQLELFRSMLEQLK